ncbi:hypothetical protein ACFLTQ_01705 [Chloroflexota bacterium]
MAITIDSKIGEILADEKAKAIVDKHLPGTSTNPQISMASGMTFKMVAPLSGGKITPEILKAIEEDFNNM